MLQLVRWCRSGGLPGPKTSLVLAVLVHGWLPAAAQGPASALVAAYSFNEGTGNSLADGSGNGNAGVISNATWTTAGKFGSALAFNGANALVTVNDAPSLRLTRMTLEAWVNPTVVSRAWRDVIYKGNDCYLLEGTTPSSGRPGGAGTWGSTFVATYGTAALVRNTWTHLAVTYDGSALRLFVNGAQVSSRARTGNIATSTNPLQIGGDSLYGQYFAGMIDEVRIYNVALTATQIQGDMNTPIGGSGLDTQPPSTPTGLTATVVGGQINLAWTASIDNVGVAGYRVERCSGTSCTDFLQVATPPAPPYSEAVPGAGSFTYRVRAADGAGNLSAYSNSASVSIQDTQAPTNPSGLSASPASSGQINLAWTASTDNIAVTQYLVERCQGTGCGTFTQVGTSTVTSLNDTTLSPASPYSYRVRAKDASGNLSGYSNIASATTPAVDAGLLTAYSFNEGTGSTTADLSGNAVTGNLSDTSWTSSGKYSNALSFNGSTSYVDLGNPPGLQQTGSMTWSAWVFPTANPPDDGQIVAKSSGGDGWQLKTTPDTGVRTFGVAVSAGSSMVQRYSGAVLSLNTWYHVAGVYNATSRTLDIYVNGVLDNGTLVGTVPASQNSPASINANIGRRQGGYHFIGTIDDVRMYGRALSPAEIQADMNTPLGAVPDTQPPTVPTGLTATPLSVSQIALSWTASSDNTGVTGYLLETCQGSGCSAFAPLGTTASTTYTVSGLSTGTSYSFRVRAVDAADNRSGYSLVATASTLATDTTPPTTPGNLTATPVNSSQITLTWAASTDAGGLHGYSIERCLTASCTFNVIVPYITSTVFNDTGLTAGTGYSYRVRASDSAGNLSAYSNVASATTTPSDTQAPTTPANLTASASGTQVTLTWTASTDDTAVTAYLVERCQGPGCVSFTQIASLGGMSYSDPGLTPGISYSYRVRATDANANLSGYSAIASAIIPSVTPGLISGYGFSEGAGTTTADSSGHGLTGALQGATWTTAGRNGNALAFNGTSSFVDLGTLSAYPLTSSATWSAWVFPTANPPDDGQIVAKSSGGDGWQLKTTPDTGVRTLGVVVSDGSSSIQRYGRTVLSLNTWYYVAGVYNAANQTLDIYINGVLDNGTLVGAVPASQHNPASINVNIGRRQGGYYFIGTIDDVRVYNRALSPVEIQADMTTPVGNAPPLPALTLSSTSVNFGIQGTGTTSPPQAVTMTSSGTQPVNIAGIVVSGVHSTDFSQTNNCPNSLAPGASCTISITFSPSAIGSRSASVVISDNAPGSPQAITLTGAGAGFGVTPKVSVLTSSLTQQFTTVNGSGTVTWLVDGVAGGSAAAGTITSTGLYTPPATAGNHTVTASTSESQTASAIVYISNYAGTFTIHNDNARTGQNTSETVLTRTNVDSVHFGRLFAYATDGISHASPLYVSSVNIQGIGPRNVVYIATEHNSLYAFDADGRRATPFWQVSVNGPGGTPVPPADTGETGDINPEIGITGTPVIDPASNTIYLVAKTKESSGGNPVYRHRLHAIDLGTGAEKFGGPVILQASVVGTGSGSSGGSLAFDALRHNQRPALLLSGGVIYIAFSSHGDQGAYHGWVLGYNAATLQQTMAYCVSPNGSQGGIWQSGMGPAADSAGNIYFMTANGVFSANTGGTEYGDSFVKISPAGAVVDYFTPKNQAIMNSNNWDLASAGPMLLPDQAGPRPQLLVGAGKDSAVYLVDRNNMGHFTSNDSQVVQALYNIFPNGTPEPGNYSAPVYFNGTVYFGPVNDRIQAFRLTNGLFGTAPVSTSSIVFPYPGATLAVSSNGAASGILWAIQRNDTSVSEPGSNPAVLRAYSTDNLGTELYNSNQAGARDAFGPAAKFTIPLVANGRVYVVSQNQLTAFGLLP